MAAIPEEYWKAIVESDRSYEFSSTPHLIPLFKKRYGSTPAAYRKKERKKDAGS